MTTDIPGQAEHNRRTREALRQFPEDLARLVGVPTFIVYRLWLRP